MTRIVIALVVLSLPALSPAAAQGTPASVASNPTTAEQVLLDLSRAKWRWMAEKKVDSLAALFHDSAVFVHMSRTMSRDQELEIIRTGGIWYKRAAIREASVKVMGPTAVLLNRIQLDAVVRGEEVTNPFVVTEVYVRQGDAWKLGSLAFTRRTDP